VPVAAGASEQRDEGSALVRAQAELGQDGVAAGNPFPPADVGGGEQVGEPVDRGHSDALVGAMFDQQVDERDEPRLPIPKRRRVWQTAGGQ
jgi:hypothetical protein